jgi:hypothetical protein
MNLTINFDHSYNNLDHSYNNLAINLIINFTSSIINILSHDKSSSFIDHMLSGGSTGLKTLFFKAQMNLTINFDHLSYHLDHSSYHQP